MEKKMWVAPQMEGMEFLAGEYCESVCGTNNVLYNFTCDAGGGASGWVWLEDNGVEGLQKTEGITETGVRYDADYCYAGGVWGAKFSSYHACGATHTASAKDPFLDGYYQEYSNNGWNPSPVGSVVKVIVWKGERQDDVHCTTNLDMKNWTTAKS